MSKLHILPHKKIISSEAVTAQT